MAARHVVFLAKDIFPKEVFKGGDCLNGIETLQNFAFHLPTSYWIFFWKMFAFVIYFF